MRRLVIGDIHANYDALMQCLKRSKFDYKKDKLIVLGDVVDGFPETYEVVEELLKVNNLILIKGNHDHFLTDYLLSGRAIGGWLHQGGIATVNSYLRHQDKEELPLKSRLTHSNYKKDYSYILNELMIPVTHQEFFNTAVLYHEEDDMLFVHGGFDDNKNIKEQSIQYLTWDRSIINIAKSRNIKQYKEVFIGHSTTQMINRDLKPIQFNNLWMLDTGAGWDGKLTIMDIDTKEYWQSDINKNRER